MKINRRTFIYKFVVFVLGCLAVPVLYKRIKKTFKKNSLLKQFQKSEGVNSYIIQNKSEVYIAKYDSPEVGVKLLIDKMGGIGNFVGNSDIVIIKPNAQRYNQGMTNTDSIKGFIELVLNIDGFDGEIIVAENHHFQNDEVRGWVTEHRNGNYNLNELISYFQNKGFANVTKYHWRDAGVNSRPLEGDACCGNIVRGPWDGDGYVWCDDIYYVSPWNRKCLMTYPVFTSKYSGITVDFKNGAWKDGRYLDKKVKIINFSALNHHSSYAGVTASIKNLMGIVDLTCGFHGDLPENCYNVHFIGVDKRIRWLNSHWRIKNYKGKIKFKFISYCYRNFHHTGATLGFFLNTIRQPDLHIIAADLVGWGDRTDLLKAYRAKMILASNDPLALDYIAAREILLPVTPTDALNHEGIPYVKLNDPDNEKGPFNKFLKECSSQGIGNLDVKNINIKYC